MKEWIQNELIVISHGHINPFTGEFIDDKVYVHFKEFTIPLEECEKYDSFEELLKDKLKSKQ